MCPDQSRTFTKWIKPTPLDFKVTRNVIIVIIIFILFKLTLWGTGQCMYLILSLSLPISYKSN